jgi:hypothetical protein
VLLALPAARAADWQVLYSGTDMTIKLDASSIEQREGALVAWEEVSFATDQTDEDHPSPYRSEVELWAYECALGQASIVELTEYSEPDAQGKAVAKGNSAGKYTWVHVPPRSIPDFGLKFVCSHMPSAAPQAAAQPEINAIGKHVPLGPTATGGGGIGAGNSLDKPVTSQPTLRSEIKRGNDAAFACTLTNGPLKLDQAHTCLEKAQHDNRQKMSTGYEAFDAGLYLMAWDHFQTAARLLKDSQIGDPEAASRNAELYWKLYRIRLKDLGLSDDAVIEASGLTLSVMQERIADAHKLYGN